MSFIHTREVQTKADYQAVLALRFAVFVDEQGVSPEEEVDETEHNATYFLAELNGQIVGTARLRPCGLWIKVERMATAKEHRRRGVGATLIAHLIAEAERRFPDQQLILHAQLGVRRFYEGLGWQPIGPHFEEAGITHVAMIYCSNAITRKISE